MLDWFQPSHFGVARKYGAARPRGHQVGHGFVSPGSVRNLLLFFVERNLYFRESGVVHGSLPVRCTSHTPSQRDHVARLRRRYQVLLKSKLQRHHVSRSKSSCSKTSIIFYSEI